MHYCPIKVAYLERRARPCGERSYDDHWHDRRYKQLSNKPSVAVYGSSDRNARS